MKQYLVLDVKQMLYLEIFVTASSKEEAQAKIDKRFGSGYTAIPISAVFKSHNIPS